MVIFFKKYLRINFYDYIFALNLKTSDMITPKRYQRIVNNIESILHLMRDKNPNISVSSDIYADRKNVDCLVNYMFKNANDLEKKLIIDNYNNGSFKFIFGVTLNEYLKTYEEIKDAYSFKY